jgi:hypothetical protein
MVVNVIAVNFPSQRVVQPGQANFSDVTLSNVAAAISEAKFRVGQGR